MGLQAASAHYQRCMDLLLAGLQPDVAISYIDDIAIYSETWEEHVEHLAAVLDRVGGAGFRFKAKKCFIGMSSMKFLGFEVSAAGVIPDPDRIAGLRDMDT